MVPGNFTNDEFWFRRVGGENETRRIVNIDFQAERLSRVYGNEDFLQERL